MVSTLAERLQIAMAGPPRVTAAKLARACGIKPPSVHGWTSGKTKSIEGANLLAAARALNINPDWLANGLGPMRPDQEELPHTVRAPSPPAYLDPPQIQEATALLRQLSPDQLKEAINYLRWQVANRSPPGHGQAVSVAA